MLIQTEMTEYTTCVLRRNLQHIFQNSHSQPHGLLKNHENKNDTRHVQKSDKKMTIVCMGHEV